MKANPAVPAQGLPQEETRPWWRRLLQRVRRPLQSTRTNKILPFCSVLEEEDGVAMPESVTTYSATALHGLPSSACVCHTRRTSTLALQLFNHDDLVCVVVSHAATHQSCASSWGLSRPQATAAAASNKQRATVTHTHQEEALDLWASTDHPPLRVVYHLQRGQGIQKRALLLVHHQFIVVAELVLPRNMSETTS